MALIKPKFNKHKARRTKLNNRNKIEYLHNQLKKMKVEKNALVQELEHRNEVLQYTIETMAGDMRDKKMELHSEKEKVKDMKKQVECPVCLDVPRKGPIFACPNGHLVCQKCKRKTCPTCREALGKNKSLVAVKIIEKILHDCKFSECDKEFGLHEIERHEKSCEHRLVGCPNYAECNQRVPLSKLLDHLQNKPCSSNSDPIVYDQSSGVARLSVSIPQLDTNLIRKGVKTFLYMGLFQLALRMVKLGENWHFTVVIFKSPEKCSNLNIVMEVYETDSPPTDTRLGAMAWCHPCSIDEPVSETSGFGLCVNQRLMERMKLTVSFSFFSVIDDAVSESR